MFQTGLKRETLPGSERGLKRLSLSLFLAHTSRPRARSAPRRKRHENEKSQKLKLASPKTAASASGSISSNRVNRTRAVQPGAWEPRGKRHARRFTAKSRIVPRKSQVDTENLRLVGIEKGKTQYLDLQKDRLLSYLGILHRCSQMFTNVQQRAKLGRGFNPNHYQPWFQSLIPCRPFIPVDAIPPTGAQVRSMFAPALPPFHHGTVAATPVAATSGSESTASWIRLGKS